MKADEAEKNKPIKSEAKENETKKKVIIFLVGLMLGAIIATGAIYVYTLAANNNSQPSMPFQNEDQGANGRPNGNTDGQMGNPPEMPNNNQGQQAN